jgi:hypothetical protein
MRYDEKIFSANGEKTCTRIWATSFDRLQRAVNPLEKPIRKGKASSEWQLEYITSSAELIHLGSFIPMSH